MTAFRFPQFRAAILGAPASGKGTISSRIVNMFNIVHISSGNKLRQHVTSDTDLGRKVKKYLDSGTFVPDNIMLALISNEIDSVGKRNWILDGYPRTLAQAIQLQDLHSLNLVVNIVVPHSVILNRIASRWTHMPSGRVYNIGFNDPQVPGRDDVTGEPLCQREDDKPEIVKKRLKEYEIKTKPIVDFYQRYQILRTFYGDTTNEIWPAIQKCIAGYF